MKPKEIHGGLRTAGRWVILTAIPVAFLEVMRWAAGERFSPTHTVIRWSLVAVVLVAARFGRLRRTADGRWWWPRRALVVAAVAAAAVLVYSRTQGTNTWLAWLTLGGLYAWLMILAEGCWAWQSAAGHRRARFLARSSMVGVTMAFGGLAPILIDQVETRFSEEEFFALVSAVPLSLFTGLLLAAHLRLSASVRDQAARPGLRLDIRWVLLGLIPLTIAGGWGTVRAYQTSFYPPVAPTFEGISAATPFLCAQAPVEDGASTNNAAVFYRLLALVETNPNKGAPEYGMLALATGNLKWAGAFRNAILADAGENRFAGPAHSVKSTQFQAALHVYYLWKIDESFPGLFTKAEQSVLRAWLAAVNGRALTVEWVDWMYALAFSKWPEGPYENQENGAGLLAMLEVSGYADPELSSANRAYLARNERGWHERFRNNDDAYIYQPEWLSNALFQSMYTGSLSQRNQRLSFEWLLLQSLPDSSILRYNHPAHWPVTSIAYLGAQILTDSRFLWLADRSLAHLEAEGKYLTAQPGLETPVPPLDAKPPSDLSCLLYGDSGLPNQLGPLAPDKIVFRDDWSPDATYALLNLRFAGWHRYKATNTITLLYQAGPLVEDCTLGQPYAWLPEGRSLFRDKRIPRENLNGLLIERSGMSAVLYRLTGIGGPWAQDPPYYANVIGFETGDELDWSHTQITDWRGWQHDRWVYFYHRGGPVIIIDKARGPTTRQAALAWHLNSLEAVNGQRYLLRSGEQPVEMLLMTVGADDASPATVAQQGNSSSPDLVHLAPSGGRLQMATLFLFGEWVGAEAGWDSDGEDVVLWIEQNGERIAVPVHE